MSFKVQDLVRKEVLNFEPYIPGKPIAELKREFNIDTVYKLASNENSLGASRKSIEKLQEILENIHRYPDSICFDLRKRLAEKLQINENNVLFGNGSDEIIELLGKTFLNYEDEIVVAEHSFVRYKMSADLMGGITKIAKMTKDFVVDCDELLKLISPRTKMIFIGNPNNPTGTYVTKVAFEKFMQNVPENILVVMDEAYYEFAKENVDYPDTKQMQASYKNIIILRTFSKLFALAGLRVGYMIADKDIVGFVDRIRPPFNVNIIAQAVAIEGLVDEEHKQKSLELAVKGKNFLYQEFEKMNIEYLPTATNFILFKTKLKGRQVFQELLKKGIIIRAVDEYDLADYARVTIGTEEENKNFIKALKEVMIKS